MIVRASRLLRCARVLCWLALVAVRGPLMAQEVPLSSIAEVHRVLTDPARTTATPMRFRGTVIFTSRAGDFCLQQDAAGVMIEPPDPALRPALGDLVEMEAAIAYHAADTLDPGFVLKTTSTRVVGPGTLPEPAKINLPAALRQPVTQMLLIEATGLMALLARLIHKCGRRPGWPAFIALSLAGLALAQEEKPDLILCDVMIPGMDGHAVLHTLR